MGNSDESQSGQGPENEHMDTSCTVHTRPLFLLVGNDNSIRKGEIIVCYLAH